MQHPGTHAAGSADAPLTPVVYVVLWTSIAVGVLRGYIIGDTIAARQTPSYTRTFSGVSQAYILAKQSAFCSTGVDGLPGLSWYETVAELVPLLVPLFGAVLVKDYGRKLGIMLGCALAVVGQVLLAAAVNVVMLYIGGAFVRAASDMLYLSSGMQIIEIAPRNSRGRFLMAHMLGYSFGYLLSAVLGFFIADQGSLGWRLLFGVGVLPAAAVLLVLPWLYETPHSLIQRGEYSKGWSALQDIRGPFFDAYPEYQSIVTATAAMPKAINMYTQLLRNPIHRPAIIMCSIMALLSALMNPLTMTYVSYTAFRIGGYHLRWATFLSSICTAGAYTLGVIVAALAVDKRGRLVLLRSSSVLCFVTLLSMVTVSAVHVAGMDTLSVKALMGWAWIQLAMLSVLSAANGLAWSSASWVIIIESQSLVVRPAAIALCIACAGMGTSLIETKLLCQLGLYYYIIVFALSVLSLVLSIFFVPETSKVPLESITSVWLQHWFWRKVVHTTPPYADPDKHSEQLQADNMAALAAFAAATAAASPPSPERFHRHHHTALADSEQHTVEDLVAELQRQEGL